MADTDELENMVLSFRVSELQMLLGFAGRNKSGRKDELQTRALELLKLRSHHAELKIRELYKTIQANQLSAHQMYGQSGTGNEPSIDQNLHQRSDDSRQSHNLSWARAMRSRPNQQQPLLILVSQKDLPPAHQASMPQSQVTRSAAAYQPTTHNTVTAQAIIKNAQKLGLIGEEKNKFNCPEIYRVLNQLTALTFLPPSQVIKTFHQLQNKTKEDFGNHFDQLFEYYESQWLKQTKPEGFNVYGSHEDRTDNIMEAHHRDRNRDLEKNLLPSIFIGNVEEYE
ncbi:uncharacterized protein LOC130665874 isoform X2 [Microplitis mediator]|uniref:uncharacterized protein LOC130665874 isoform X2 n=1 Tax=Microplitis mediator TaxID=375433 RepID=UPI002556FA85|nr:uncharacterized protein LOC130665874 isoform X2 [Microplitis mediator]